mgnify:CR=1 FL=1
MRIAFIGGFSNLYDEEGKAKTFELLGAEVLRIEESSFTGKTIELILKWGPDILMSPKYKINNQLREELFSSCRREGILICSWHPDLYHYPYLMPNQNRFAEITNKIGLWSSDVVFSPEGGEHSDAFYSKCGIKQYTVRQAPYHETVGISNIEDISDITTKEVPLLFVGTAYTNGDGFRQFLLKFLEEQYGEKFMLMGHTAEHQVRESRLSSLIAQSKIIIGESTYFPGYWSNRLYESIGRGGFTLHPYVAGIEDEFVDGEECVYFSRWNFKELKEKIDYYLDEPEERNRIINNGLARVKKDHTLINRCTQVLEIINELRNTR